MLRGFRAAIPIIAQRPGSLRVGRMSAQAAGPDNRLTPGLAAASSFPSCPPDPHRRYRLKLLEYLATLCAVPAGALLTAIALMTCASLIGRNTTGATIVGDFELTGAATGAAIALFMPFCQIRRGNIIMDF